jgi:hypothetical protein
VPIKFVAGQSSASVTGSVGSDEPFPSYSLDVGKGQTANLKFTKTNGNMAFTIYGVVDDRDSYSFRPDAACRAERVRIGGFGQIVVRCSNHYPAL